MKIKLPGGRRSDNLRDQRGQSVGGIGGGGVSPGMIALLPLLMKGGSPIMIVVLLALFVLPQMCSSSGGFGGIDAGPQNFPGVQEAQPGESLPPASAEEEALVDFVSFVLDDLQAMWTGTFADAGRQYEDAELVLFEDTVRSGCGAQSSQTGPFYCPADQSVYLDLSFFRELQSRFDAPGDFAQAYVIAHEIGHHVQFLLGTSEEVQREAQRNPDDANELSVRQELQADCFAGVWAFSTFERGLLEDGDLEEGLAAASGVGDDRIQRETTGRVNPDSFTHGTSAQRQKWFQRGYDSGDPSRCDTFSGGI